MAEVGGVLEEGILSSALRSSIDRGNNFDFDVLDNRRCGTDDRGGVVVG